MKHIDVFRISDFNPVISDLHCLLEVFIGIGPVGDVPAPRPRPSPFEDVVASWRGVDTPRAGPWNAEKQSELVSRVNTDEIEYLLSRFDSPGNSSEEVAETINSVSETYLPKLESTCLEKKCINHLVIANTIFTVKTP